MSIALDAATGGYLNPATSLTLPLTVSGTDRALWAAVSSDYADVINTPTYAGVPMTLVTKLLSTRWLHLFYLNAPATGNNNFVLTAPSSILLEANIASYTGVKQTGQPEVFNSGSGSGTGATGNVTTLTNNSWTVMAAQQTGGSLTAGAGSVRRATSLIGSIMDSGADVTPAGLKTMAFTANAGNPFAWIVAAMAPAPVVSDLAGNVTLDNLVAAGTLSVIPSSLSGNVTIDDLVTAGTLGQAPGTITVPGLRNAARALVASTNIANVVVIRISDRAILASLANQATNGSGDLILSGVAFVPGTPVMVLGFDVTGANSFRRAVTVV